MKKYISVVLVTLMIMGIIISCKKNSDSTPPTKDYSASIKNKTWWGQLTNAGESAQYYSVHFNADSSLVWSQQAGVYPGQWIVNGKQLTMDFASIGVKVTADIADDDKLMNIVTNTPNKVNSGQLIVNPNIPLDNTVWYGFINVGYSPEKIAFQLNFMPGLIVDKTIGTGSYGTTPYTRSSYNAVIKFKNNGYPFFGVVVSANEIRGSYYIAANPSHKQYYTWQTTKQ